MRILRPAGGLADVGVSDVRATGHFRKQRRLLGAAHDQRLAAGRRGAEFFEFGPAELARGCHLSAATATPHGGAVERHRVFARADQDVWRPIGHFVSGWARSAMYFAVIIRAGASSRRLVERWRPLDARLRGRGTKRGSGPGAYHVIIITNNLRESGTQMPLQERPRLRTSSRPAFDLPPPFRLVTLREVGDAFAHATRVAAEEGAGTLVYVGRFDLAEFAVVLEPEEPLKTARRALYAGLTALADALAVHAPPERPITFDWPDGVRVNGGLVGGARLAWPE